MSVVVAVKDADRVWIACDSQVSCGGNKHTMKSQRKVWKDSECGIVYGLVGDMRDINILSTAESFADKLTILQNAFNLKYVIRTMVPKIFKELKEFDRIRNRSGITEMESNIVIAKDLSVYSIYSDGSVIEEGEFSATGSGQDLALGAGSRLIKNETMSKKDVAIEMVKAACQLDLYVNYPIVVMNTKDDEVIVIDK